MGQTSQYSKTNNFADELEKGSLKYKNNINENLNNEYYINQDPDERDYFIKCPDCGNLIGDTGFEWKIICETCKKEINMIDNNFQEIKKSSLYSNEIKSKKCPCKFLSKFLYKSSLVFRFMKSSPKYPISPYDYVIIYINKDSYDNSIYSNQNFNFIINNVLITFLQFKSRIVTENKVFILDGLEFKIISALPHLLSGKITSKTGIICNNFYSNKIPIEKVILITKRLQENKSNETITNLIKETPFTQQLSIVENLICRINGIEFYVKKCIPSYGIINYNTNIEIINKNIEELKTITIAILNNELNDNLNQKSNKNSIIKNYIEPYFFKGITRYIQKEDIIKINDIQILILQANPSEGFVIENKTKIKYIYNYNNINNKNNIIIN